MEGQQGILGSKSHRTKVSPVVTAAVTLTTIAEFDIPECEQLFGQLTVAVAALTEFELQGRPTAGSSYAALANATADFTTPNAPVIWASGDLTIAGVGVHHFLMDVRGIESVRVQAKSAGTATAAVNAGAN